MCLKMENFNDPKWRIFPNETTLVWSHRGDKDLTGWRWVDGIQILGAESGFVNGPIFVRILLVLRKLGLSQNMRQPTKHGIMGWKKHTKMIANEDTAKWNRIDLTNISMWLYHNIQLYTWISVEFGPLRVQSTQLDIFCWFFSQMWIPKEASETDSEMNMIFFSFQLATSDFQRFKRCLFFVFFSSQEHIIEYRVPQRSGGRGEESSRNFPTPNSISTLQKPWVFVGDFNRFGTRLTRLRDGMIRKYPYQHIPYSQPHSYHPKKHPGRSQPSIPHRDILNIMDYMISTAIHHPFPAVLLSTNDSPQRIDVCAPNHLRILAPH